MSTGPTPVPPPPAPGICPVIPNMSRLPLHGIPDGTEVKDEVGNIYIFDAEDRTWIFKGQPTCPPIVTDTVPGLVPPAIFEKLQLLSQLKNKGIDFRTFKLATAANGGMPYFYFFFSTDNLIRFIPEGPSRLRLEIDRGKLLAKLTRQCCVGPQGLLGVQGLLGRDGIPADPEIFQIPDAISGPTLKLSTTVATPIDTPISLRFYKNSVELAEILIPIDAIFGDVNYDQVLYDATGAVIINIIDPTIGIEATSLQISYDKVTQVLLASVTFTGNTFDISKWRYKARQRGAKGDTGPDGKDFFTVSSQFYDDPLLRSNQAIVSLRKPNTSNDVLFVKKPLFNEICSFNLTASGGQIVRNKPEKLNLVATRVTPKQCKDIGNYQFIKPDFTIQTLDLPAWTPTGDCCDSSVYNVRNMNWFNQVDPQYAFKIAVDPRPPEQCCEEDFFWCPNIGDQPCGVIGGPQPPKPKPPNGKPCKCDSPIANQLQGGGFTFPAINCLAGPMTGATVSSTIGGTTDHYTCNVQTKGHFTFTWHIDWDDKLCGDGKPGQTPKDKCKVENTAQDGNGNPQANGIPSDITYSGGDDSDCNVTARTFTLAVNTNKKDCCRGYKVTPKIDCSCHSSSSSSSSSMPSSSSSSSTPTPTPSSSSSSSSSSEEPPIVDMTFECSSSSSSSSSSV